MIGRWLLYGVASWCFLIGVWEHDWRLIVASLALAVLYPLLDDDLEGEIE